MSLVKRNKQPLPYKRPPKRLKKAKQIEKYAAAYARGITIGTQKGHEKKSLEDSAREHIGHWIDNLNPLELVAIGGMTVIVHNFILDPANNVLPTAIKAITSIPQNVITNIVAIYQTELNAVTGWNISMSGGNISVSGKPSEKLSTQEKVPGLPQWELWLLAFTIAFIIVKYGAQILGTFQGGLGALIPMLMGAVV
jgi:hypothetical protein